ncbi:YjbF family lipoprotein [Phaeobacter sp. HF9A]|uniref:YjbF family lipoprotein n=1 Tax=Phaeobacter sp. HF9A TaxID=2721561 RepID=UPI001431D737|nr:YjbF family lipoprotein [Phaeobacter sp. HF9A]NIZ15501.1 YjbF family lipoprotein [Phaeobacter sp. HF9A]
MKYLYRPFAGLMMLALLAACAQGPEDTPLELEVGQVIREQVRLRSNRKNKPQPPTLTRALLDTIQEPHVEMVIEDVDLRDYLTLQLARNDDQPGRIEIWHTVDNITFGFRDGMLISTRGLRGTLLSAQVPADGQGAMGPASGGQRFYEFSGDDNGSYQIWLACDLQDLGAKALDVVGKTYPTRHLREVCQGQDGGRVINDYWVDSLGGRVRQSRQWAGPDIGYIRTRQVVD